MHTRVFIAVTLALGLLAAGCSDDSAPPSVASLESESSTTLPTETEADPIAESEDAVLAFTQCLRDQGFDIDDPTVDADGNLQLAPITFEVEAPSDDPGAMPDLSEFDALMAPCEEYLEGVVMNAPAADMTEMEDSLLAYAQCMRSNGVDMPDPDFSSGMIDLGDVGADEFEAADAACKHHLASLGLSEVEAP